MRRVGEGADYWTLLQELAKETPFTASGLACAFETAQDGGVVFNSKVETPIPLVGLCAGDTPEECAGHAESLVAQGYGTLKMKVAAVSQREDSHRVIAVDRAVPDSVELRLDANQAMGGVEPAVAFCSIIENLGRRVWLEQPLPPEDWEGHRELARRTGAPLMLDESIHNAEDIDNAVWTGAKAVKFKLCKHPGMKAAARIIQRALDAGLEVVLGNGVQTEVGNHLEAVLHHRTGLETAFEGNGFLKPAGRLCGSSMTVSRGELLDGEVRVEQILENRAPLVQASFAYLPLDSV
jgi:L-alanine-DL-glutamate epimerase-like enolase superfamily enzyme